MMIIAIEGLDKSGKYSQCELLVERLQREGYKVATGEFHDYNSPTGKLISQWLCKEWKTDQVTIELIMAADKQQHQAHFRQLEEEGYDFLVLDRYILSQQVYGIVSGSFVGYDYPLDIREWLDELLYYTRKPDFTILIDLPAEVSMVRKGKHNNGENDRYESDFRLLAEVREEYKRQVNRLQGVIVDGTRSTEEIQERIWQEMQHRIL